MYDVIQFTLNGKPATVSTDGNRMLLWVLRTDLRLTGTKYGCGENHCGACTVLVDGEAVRSCSLSLKEVRNKNVMTVEGLATGGELHPLQHAFIRHDALQCGYCTPGMIMQSYALLRKNPRPSTSQIVEALEHNLCRCGAHPRIVEAVRTAALELKEGE